MDQLGIQPIDLIFCNEHTQIYYAQAQSGLVYLMQELHFGLPVDQAQTRISNLMQLSHPNIMKVLNAVSEPVEQGSLLTIVYEYCHTNLLDFIQSLQGRFLSAEIMKTLVTQFLSALEFLESQKFHHLSIRPQCVFITEDHHLVIGFFPSDLLSSSNPQVVRDYNVEAEAVGNLILMLQMLEPPYKLLQISKDFYQSFDQVTKNLHMPEILRQTLSVLLKPELFTINFRMLRDNFVNNRNLQNIVKAKKQTGISKCELCPLESQVVLNCTHRFCSAHTPDIYCPLCPSGSVNKDQNQEPRLSLEEQMEEWRSAHSIPNRLNYKELIQLPRTISQKRFPLPGLSALNRDRGQVLVERLSHVFTSWRSSANDGNSFFRCLGVIWLERLFSPNTPKALREKWITRLRLRKRQFVSLPEVAHIYQHFISALIPLHENTAGNRLALLQDYLLDPEFNNNLVVFMRCVSTQYFNLNNKEQVISSVVATADRLSQLQTFGKEIDAFNPLVQCVADAFSYHIDVYSLEPHILKQIKCQKPASTTIRRASLLFMNGCYFILYSVTQDLLDGYDCASNTFSPVQATKQYNCDYL